MTDDAIAGTITHLARLTVNPAFGMRAGQLVLGLIDGQVVTADLDGH